MNYLGHAYLSYGHPQILVGNMVRDFVKGKVKFDFPEVIQKGFVLHREIDNFTDTHPAITEAKKIFRPDYRLYSSPIVDVILDHFLAVDHITFPAGSLLPFTQHVYQQLEKQQIHFPERFVVMFTYMKTENWLYGYAAPAGIQRSLQGLVCRSSFLVESDTAYRLFQLEYAELQQLAAAFLPDVKNFAKDIFDTLNS